MREVFILSITGGFQQEFDHYPTQEEIEKVVNECHPPDGITYRVSNPKSNLLKPIYIGFVTDRIEAKVDKIYVMRG